MFRRQIWILAALLIGIFGYIFAPAAAQTNQAVQTQPAEKPPAPKQTEPAPIKSEESWENRFNRQVASWIKELASKDERFASWEKAEWSSESLGPGTHGWYIELTKGGQPVGYLVVQAAPDDKLILVEYGIGSSPLFSMQRLNESLALEGVKEKVSPDAKKLYINGLHSLWEVTRNENGDILYFHSQTGERYPILAAQLEETPNFTNESIPAVSSLVKTQYGSAFDPYEDFGWLVDELGINKPDESGEPSALTSDQIYALLLKNERVTFTANLYNNTVLFAYAAVAVHSWNEGDSSQPAFDFIGLEEEGNIRYLPYPLLDFYGQFHGS